MKIIIALVFLCPILLMSENENIKIFQNLTTQNITTPNNLEKLEVLLKEPKDKVDNWRYTPKEQEWLDKLYCFDDVYSEYIQEKLLNEEKSLLLFPYAKIIDEKTRIEYDFNSKLGLINTLFYKKITKNGDLCIFFCNTYTIWSPGAYRIFRNTPSFRVLVKNNKTQKIITSSWKNKGLFDYAASKMFLDFGLRETNTFPDVFILDGPGGSGSFFNILRYSYDLKSEKWEKSIWGEEGLSPLRNFIIDRDNNTFSWYYIYENRDDIILLK